MLKLLSGVKRGIFDVNVRRPLKRTSYLAFGLLASLPLISDPSLLRAQTLSSRRAIADKSFSLTQGQRDSLRALFPNVFVQTVATTKGRWGPETWVVAWEQKPITENRCPEIPTAAYDIQSCTGFQHALSGNAHIVRLTKGVIDSIALTQFFQHDANPSGVEIDGERGTRQSFLPSDFEFEFVDLNADGLRNEILLHVGNGPYAYIEYWIAFAVTDNKLHVMRSPETNKPLIGNRDAWLSLAQTGHGQSDLYCGVRCGGVFQRWTLDRDSTGRIRGQSLWTCTPDDARGWKIGEPQHGCPE